MHQVRRDLAWRGPAGEDPIDPERGPPAQLAGPEAIGHAPVILMGQFCGAVLWWLVLSGAVSVLRGRLTGALLDRVNHCAALALGATALLTALRALP